MRDNAKLKAEKRADTQRNQSKMVVRGRSIFNLVRIKRNKHERQKKLG